MIVLTKDQLKALFRVFQRNFPSYVSPRRRYEKPPCPHCGYGGDIIPVPSIQWRIFRAKVFPLLDNSGCIMVPIWGMFLGIERDGYTHS